MELENIPRNPYHHQHHHNNNNNNPYRNSTGSGSDSDYLYFRSSSGIWDNVWQWDDDDSDVDAFRDAPEWPYRSRGDYPDTPTILTPNATNLTLRRPSSLEDITALPAPEPVKEPDQPEKKPDKRPGPPVRLPSRRAKDPNLVTWNGPNDPENPKNWSVRRRWAAIIVVSSFTFITPVSSTIVAPAFEHISKDLHITQDVELQMVLSIFVLAYAIGPLLLAPLSETFGRVYVLQLSNLFYFCWNLACGFARTRGELITFRFLAGLGGSAPLAIGGGVLSDCFLPEHRGKAISVYSLAPLLGPAIGPIAGGFISQYANWRWIFWAPCVVDVFIQIVGLLFFQETYGPYILKKKAKRLRKETGNTLLHTPFDGPNTSIFVTVRRASVRPFSFLTTQPIIIVIATYIGFLYGVMYLVLATFPRLWTHHYNESTAIGSLNYASLALGFLIGAQVAPRINDINYRRLLKKNNGVRKPEFRIPPAFFGTFFCPIGIFIYGWAAQYHTHWIVPNVGTFFFGMGINITFNCMQGYTVDCYQRFAASGVAATVVLRSLAGFFFPLFAPYMYKALGYGWGNTILGIISAVIGLPTPYIFWFYGQKMRAKSSYAVGGRKSYRADESVAGGPGGQIAPGHAPPPGSGPAAGGAAAAVAKDTNGALSKEAELKPPPSRPSTAPRTPPPQEDGKPQFGQLAQCSPSRMNRSGGNTPTEGRASISSVDAPQLPPLRPVSIAARQYAQMPLRAGESRPFSTATTTGSPLGLGAPLFQQARPTSTFSGLSGSTLGGPNQVTPPTATVRPVSTMTGQLQVGPPLHPQNRSASALSGPIITQTNLRNGSASSSSGMLAPGPLDTRPISGPPRLAPLVIPDRPASTVRFPERKPVGSASASAHHSARASIHEPDIPLLDDEDEPIQYHAQSTDTLPSNRTHSYSQSSEVSIPQGRPATPVQYISSSSRQGRHL